MRKHKQSAAEPGNLLIDPLLLLLHGAEAGLSRRAECPPVLLKPSSRARLAISYAPCGCCNCRCRGRGRDCYRKSRVVRPAAGSFRSSTFRLFFETSSGSTLSMLICK